MKNGKQKLYGAALIALGIITTAMLKDGTLLLFAVPAGIALIASKKNWIV